MKPTSEIPLRYVPRDCSARIVKIGASNTVRGSSSDDVLEHLLLELGFEEGAKVEIRYQAAFGGPLAVQVEGRLIALRPSDAAAILVETETQEHLADFQRTN